MARQALCRQEGRITSALKTVSFVAALFASAALFSISEIWHGSTRPPRRDKVHPDLKLHHPRITPEFLSSFKPTPLDFAMGWVIVDESAKKYPNHITADDLRTASKPLQDGASPTERPRIINRGNFLWTDGASDLASSKNNEAMTFVQANDMDRAREILEELRDHEPQFFPARFNLGRVYLFFKMHQEAIAEFEKTIQLVPQYSRNYYFLGKAFELAAKRDAADFNFLRAYRYDIYDLLPLVALGDSLLEQKRTIEALDVYKQCLKQDSGFNDALIGMGKVAYTLKKYYDATLWFRMVDTKLTYSKELHFYYGESSFFAQDYQMAAKQYEVMLNFPQDAIYSKISLARMKKRLEQTKRLLNQSIE